MNRKKQASIVSLLLTTTALVCATPADAQASAATSSTEPGATTAADTMPAEVVVTATKRSELLRKVPMTVNVATGEQLEKFKLFDLKDVPQLAPGLSISNGDGRKNIATLRGITFNPDTGGPASIAVYVNEIPVDIETVASALYDVSQIEVLRGPQGTLRGRTAPAGAITITTRRADLNKIDGYVQGTLATQGARNLQGGVSVPIVPGMVALRVAGLIDRNRLNDVYDVNRDQRSSARSDSARATLSFKTANEVVSGNISYQYLKSRTNLLTQVFGPGAQPSPFSPTRTGPAISLKDREAVQEGASINANRTHFISADQAIDLGSHVLSFLEGYQDTRLTSVSDLDTANIVSNYSQIQDIPQKQTSLTGEMRLSSNWSGRFNYVLGVFYNRTKNDAPTSLDVNQYFNNGGFPLPPEIYRLPLLAQTRIYNNSSDLALFGDVRFNVTDKLKLEVGARYTRNSGAAQSFLTISSPGANLPGFPPIPPFVISNNTPTVLPQFVKRVFHPLTGTASASYDFSQDVTGYVTYGRSYRRGTAQLGVNTPLDPSLLVLNPERSDSIEAGLKTRLFDRKVSLNIDVFYQKFNGYIDLTTANVAPARDGVVNSTATSISYNGDASSRGVEMQLDARPTPNWDIGLSASYADAHWDNARVPCNDFNGDGQPDAIGVPFVPVGQQVSVCNRNDQLSRGSKFAMNLTSEVRMDVGAIQPFLRGLVDYRPGFNSSLSNYHFPAVKNVNLYFGIRGIAAGWELSGFVKNLFNTTQVRAINADETRLGLLGSGYREISLAPPRQYGITASYKF